jgi:hypothetical protein
MSTVQRSIDIYSVLQERIVGLQSELRRLRAQLAVDTQDNDLMKFIFNMTSEDTSYVNDLKIKLAYVVSLILDWS